MNNSNRQIKMGAVLSYASTILNALISLLYLPWMAGKIGQSNYGLYILASSFINVFLVDFGLGAAVSRFIAKYRMEGEREKEERLVAIVFRLYLIIDLIILGALIIVYFFVDRIFQGLTPDEIEIFRSLYIVAATFSILSFPFMPLGGIILAYERFIQYKICEMGQRIVSIVLIVIALLMDYGVLAIVTANAVSGILAIIAKYVIVRKETGLRLVYPMKTRDYGLLKSIAGFSLWAAIVGLMERCIYPLAPAILGMVSNSREIALFAPASALESYFYMFAAAINDLFLARISQYIAENREDKIYEMMVKVGRYQMTVMGLIFVCFFCVGQDFMILWMGKEYAGAYGCALLLFLPDYFIFTQQIARTTMIAKNEVRRQAVGAIMMAVITVGLSFVLGKTYGALGSCISIAVGNACMFVYLNVVYQKYLKLDMRSFFRRCYLDFLIPFAIVGAVGWLVCNRLFAAQGWGMFLVKIVLVGLAYVLLVWMIALKRQERDELKSFIGRKLRRKRADGHE